MLATSVALGASIGSSFVSMATGGLMAQGIPEESKGRAGGWYQAGNLGGAGLGGGLGLWLTQHTVAVWIPGATLAVICLLCCLGLFFVTEIDSGLRATSYGRTMVNVLNDLWGVARSRKGFLALFLCVMPIGSGAAANLWSAVAIDWRASPGTVALVTGILGGGLSALGCLLGGWVCDQMDRKTAYVAYGLLQAACALGMALAPRTQGMYILWTCAYAVVTGLTYAGFSAFVLDAIEAGAAATKYNALTSLSNAPITCMVLLDGWAHTRWGAKGMLHAEALMGLIGMGVFLAVATLVHGLWVDRGVTLRPE